MTPDYLKQVINEQLRAGRLSDLAPPFELAATGVLAHYRLSQRLVPMRPWQVSAGIKPLDETDLKGEIRAEFKRLLDQIHEMPLEAEG